MMTTDEIIEMARQVGMEQDGENFFSCNHDEIDVHITDLTAFAKLVADVATAKERELLNTVFWAFQEWKEDHMSDSTFIDTVKYLREKSQHE